MNTSIQTLYLNKDIHFYKKITVSNGVKYKKVEYFYDNIVDGIIVETLLHNGNKPAVVIYSECCIIRIEYWYRGKLHRLFGPAVISLYNREVGSEFWYNHGTLLKQDEIESVKKVLSRKKKLYKLLYKK